MIHDVWVAQLVGQGVLAVVLITKKCWKDFPAFTVYSIFSLLSGVAKYSVYGRPNLFFFVFWISESVAVILGLAVVYEVFRYLLSVHLALRKLARFSFAFAIAILLSLGCAVVYKHSASGLQSLTSGVLLAEETARIMEVGLLMFLFLFSNAFGLHWRQPVFGICVGLGIFTAVELISVTASAMFGAGRGDLFSIIRMLAYNFSLLLWVGYLLTPERVSSLSEVPRRGQLEEWNQAIMELINQ